MWQRLFINLLQCLLYQHTSTLCQKTYIESSRTSHQQYKQGSTSRMADIHSLLHRAEREPDAVDRRCGARRVRTLYHIPSRNSALQFRIQHQIDTTIRRRRLMVPSMDIGLAFVEDLFKLNHIHRYLSIGRPHYNKFKVLLT